MTTNPEEPVKPDGDSETTPTAKGATPAGDGQGAVAAKAAKIALGILAEAQLEQMAAAPPPTLRQILPNLFPPLLIAAFCVVAAVFLSSYRMSEVDIVLEVERAEAVQIGLEESLGLRLASGERSSFVLEGGAAVDRTDSTTQTEGNQTDRVDFEAARGDVDIRIDAGAVALFHIDAPHAFDLPKIDGEPPLPQAGTTTLRIEVQGGGFDVTASPVLSVTDEDGAPAESINRLAWRTVGSLGTMTVESGKTRTGFLHVDRLRVSKVAFSRSVADTGKPDGQTSVCSLGKGTLRFVDLIGDPIPISARTCLRIAFTAAEISDLEIDETVSFALRGRVTDISIIDPSRGEDVTANLVPSLMQFIISDRSLNSQWLVVVLLWGAIWSAIRLAVSGKPS